MIRPEIRAGFIKFREVVGGCALALFGVWLALLGGWFWTGLGVIVVMLGVALSLNALRRLRFQTDQVGPGVVDVDERQISYYAAYEGGAVSINQLARVTILSDDAGPWADDLHWLLEEDGGARLLIPNSASGAEKLFDALSALNGVDFAAATRAMTQTTPDAVVLWSKPRTTLH